MVTLAYVPGPRFLESVPGLMQTMFSTTCCMLAEVLHDPMEGTIYLDERSEDRRQN